MNISLKNKSNLFLLFVIILGIIIILFNYLPLKQYENFESKTKDFTTYNNSTIYDEFYVNIYDDLVYSKLKNDYEVNKIISSTTPNEHSIVLDIGSGTGHHVKMLSEKNVEVIGLDKSKEMIKLSKKNFPECTFQEGDMMNSLTFSPDTFTHITCFYFTIYYTKNKTLFFQNCYRWLKPGGYCIIHVVDPTMFNPMLNNPLLYISPQRYAPKRITETKLIFNNMTYKSNFEYLPDQEKAIFHEKFIHKDKVRKNEHTLYMEDAQKIMTMAEYQGFITHGFIDLINCGYEYQYLYVFVKPN